MENKDKVFKIFQRAFASGSTYPDDKPLHSCMHPWFIRGIEVKGLWMKMYNLVVTMFKLHRVVNDEDGCFHHVKYTKMGNVWESLFKAVFIVAHGKKL